MAPRRQLVLLLSAIALVASSLALAPRQATAATVTFFVDTTADNDADGGCTNSNADGDCSLRQAIVAANEHSPAADIKIISFQYYTDGPLATTGATFTIDSGKVEFPPIAANSVEVRANTGFGIPEIQINGNGKPVGLQISGDDSLVSGLSLYGFSSSGVEPFLGSAIYITGDRNRVITSWIGINPNGDTPAGGQNFSGIRIDGGGTANVIGGTGGEAVANYISGNAQNGVIIRNSSGNFVQNNFIGLARPNQAPTVVLRGNGEYGVQIVSVSGTSANNVIGGDEIGLANIISGNGQAGILLRDTGTTSTTIRSNYIGIDKLTNTDFGNVGDGIRLENGTSANVIGGIPSAPLVVSGNTRFGIHLRTNGAAPRDNRIIATTYVGTGIGGTTAVPNEDGGILVANGVIGTRIEGAGTNLRVAGNNGPGIVVQGPTNNGTTIATALVGIVPIPGPGTPSDDLPNTEGGVLIEDARSTSVLSSTISGNGLFGLRASRALTPTISTNYIGADLARTGFFQNGGAGVELIDARAATLNTNVISGNLGLGLHLRGATATTALSNTVTGNGAGGVLLESVGISLTTGTSLTGTTIGGNGQYGMRLSGALTTTLRRSYIGLNPNFTDRLPNTGNGLELFDARNTFATDTYAAGNTGAGIVVSGTSSLSNTLDNTVAGLSQPSPGVGFIASEPNGGPALRITGGAQQTSVTRGTVGGAAAGAGDPAGIAIDNTTAITVSNLRIGWVTTTTSPSSPPIAHPFGVGIAVTAPVSDVRILTNTLRYNRGPAIQVTGDANRVRMLGNGLSRNGDAIDLVATTLLTARPPTSDPGSAGNPNHDIDPPPIDVTTFTDPLRLRVGDQGIVEGYVFTSTNKLEDALSPVSACITCTIQIFRPGPGAEATAGQGYELLSTFPTGGDIGQSATSFAVPESGRFTRQIVGGVGAPGTQLLLIATDGFGNSSEYSVFPVSTGFALTNLTGNQSAGPGDTVTYTLRLSNTGTLDVTGLSLRTAGTLRDWQITTDPITNTIFTIPTPLEAGTTRLLTVTMTLPRGSNPNVRAGLTDVTTVTVLKENTTISQAVRLETTVLPRPVLVVTPTNSLGKARPTETVPHTHVIRNDGNVTVTIGLTPQTIEPPNPTGPWTTSVSNPSFTLTPGTETRVRVDVTVPANTPVNDPPGTPVEARTIVSATVPLSPTGGFGPVTVIFTDTTRVDLDPDAEITDGGQVQDGAAGQQVVFLHTVRNLSNAPTRFCFLWSTNLGSTVRFESRTNGFVVDASGCFNLDTTTNEQQGRFREARFAAVVTVDRRALPGTQETLNLTLRNEETRETIGSATVVDRINVTIGLKAPRIWLPMVRR